METIPAFYFDREQLAPIAASKHESFVNAAPFQHVVLDDFLPQDVLELLVDEFPGPEDLAWEMHGPGRTKWSRDKKIAKLVTSDETKFRAFMRHFMGQLNSATFLAFLEELTGTSGIVPDVSYNNCGMHSTGPGGRLMMHTDQNRHPHKSQMHQYLNLILYLNQDWKEDYGGHLELWDNDRKPVERILPSANRVVLFNTGTRSLHGHPHPLTCPEGRRRNSLAVYYYLRERPKSEEYAGQQSTVHWVPAIEEDRAFARERRAQALAELAGMQGATVGVPPDIIPIDLPDGFIDPATGLVPLRFLAPSEWADAEAFTAKHMRTAVSNQHLPATDFLGAYEPIALLGRSGAADSVALITCLLDDNGEMYAARGPDAPDLFWVGYLDELLASLPR